MKNANMPAMPLNEPLWIDPSDPYKGSVDANGFTKREAVASRNLAAMLSAGMQVEHRTVREAIRAADMFFAELEKTR